MMTAPDEKKIMAELIDILEALVFVHRGSLTKKTIEGILKDDFTPEQVSEGLEGLKARYGERDGVITLLELAGGFELGTRTDLAPWIRKMDHYEHHRHLSRPALETLAIIAYRQPVTRAEIESIRGVNVERILRNLMDKKLIRILGRKDVPGKPIVYGTTKEFMNYFGLKSLSDLPVLKEFAEAEMPPVEEGREDAAILPMEEETEGAAVREESEAVPEPEASERAPEQEESEASPEPEAPEEAPATGQPGGQGEG